MGKIYLDNATTTRLDPEILVTMLPYLEEEFGSPSSPHSLGRRAREALEVARTEVARFAGCQQEEVFFTASASEANNLALKGAFGARGRRWRRLLVSAVEHASVLHTSQSLAREGADLAVVAVDLQGRVDLDLFAGAARDGAGLVSVMHGNPEVGTLQPVQDICRISKECGALVHIDATATAGLFPGLWRELEADLMTLSPHLFHGPKGIAALMVRRGIRLLPQIDGGIQEGGLRAGTQSVALAVGFGEAARLAREAAPNRAARLRVLGRRLRDRLEETLSDWVLTGHREARIPGHLSLCLKYVEGEAVLGLLDDAGILAGSGSACTLGAGKPSHVLQALGLDPVLARGAVDFCLSKLNTPEEVDEVGVALTDIVARLRRLSPLAPGAAEV